LNKLAINAASKRRIATIECNDALILPHCANPAGWNFWEPQAWFAVTRHPTAEWLAQQIIEAFPWETAPTYLVRDNDGAYGPVFRRRVQAMGDLPMVRSSVR
jgi:hypothetical protein